MNLCFLLPLSYFFAAYVCLAKPSNTKGENTKYLFLNVLKAGQFPSMGKMLLAEGFLANAD